MDLLNNLPALAEDTEALRMRVGVKAKELNAGKLRLAARDYGKVATRNSPADERELVRRFLKEDDFLLTSANAYNTLGLGTTQLYNTWVVYNHKRHGRFTLGDLNFEFRRKPRFPQNLTEEFLLVDLLNNLPALAVVDDPGVIKLSRTQTQGAGG